MEKKNFIITGGAGFIGSQLASSFLKDGHNVIIIDNLSTGKLDNVPSGSTFIEANCHDKNLIQILPKLKYEAIYHIAGQSSGEISFEDPIYDCESNTISTINLLEICKSLSVKRFIYASTMSVYGEKDNLNKVKESDEKSPVSFYAIGKLASENYLHIYAKYGINSTAVRLFNVYGPGQNLDNLKQGMVSIFVAQALLNKHIHIKGSNDRIRDLIYIDDVIYGFKKILDNSKSFNKQINFCTGRDTSVQKMLDIIISSFEGEKITTEFSGATEGDVFGFCGDNSQFHEVLGEHSFISVEEGIKKMINYYL